MVRLPQPGGDDGEWGRILNEYLSVSHASDGSILPSSVGAAQIQANAVSTSTLLDSAVTEMKLTAAVRTKLDAAATIDTKQDIATLAQAVTTHVSDGSVLAQTLRDKALAISVKEYGATGDGTTDDTAAIQAAIDSLPLAGGAIYLPAGTYKLSAAIAVRNALKLFGDGNSATVLYQTNLSAHGISGTDILSLSIEDMRVSGPTNGTGIGIMMERFNNNATNYLYIKNVYVRTFGGDGIYVSNAIVSRFDLVVTESNAGNGFNLVGLNGVIGTSTQLNSCFANANGLSGYRIDTMGYMSFNACAADSNQVSYELLNCIGLSFSGCGSEGSETHGWKFVGGYGSTIVGGWVFMSNGIAAHITGNAVGITIIGLSETTPNTNATACIQVDSGSKASLLNIHNSVPNVLAAATTQIFNDVSGNSSFNGSLNIDGALTINGQAVRGSKWYLSNSDHVDYTDVTDMQDGDIFMYGNSRDLFNYNATTQTWVYSGTLAA